MMGGDGDRERRGGGRGGPRGERGERDGYRRRDDAGGKEGGAPGGFEPGFRGGFGMFFLLALLTRFAVLMIFRSWPWCRSSFLNSSPSHIFRNFSYWSTCMERTYEWQVPASERGFSWYL
jgi:hypothetical protein